MSKIVQFFQDTNFDPEMTQIMGQVYDKAYHATHVEDSPTLSGKLSPRKSYKRRKIASVIPTNCARRR